MAQRNERRIHCDSSSAAETVANIEELLSQILVLIPALSLIRFKCVSRHWLTLISDPEFFRRHLHQKSKISGFFSSQTEDESFKSIALSDREIPSGNPFKAINDSFGDGSRLKIIQSCNGLFLCLRYSRDISLLRQAYGVKDHPAYVVNPTTNKFLALYSPTVMKNKKYDRYSVRYALAFDPSISPFYKVVCVTNYSFWGQSHHLDIYSSETEEWKELLMVPLFPSYPMHFDHRSTEGAVYCNGKIHWIRRITDRYGYDSWCHFRDGRFIRDEGDVLHYFDIDEQSLQLVAAATPVPVAVRADRYFGESGGHLYLIEFYKHYDPQFDIMEMERDYSCWFIKHHVDLNLVFAALPNTISFVVLCLSPEEEKDAEEEDSSCNLWLHMPGKVMSYNLRNKTFKTSAALADKELFLALDNDRCSHMEAANYPYMETLACV
ncbi:F-box protein At5g07610-like [Rosa rugosa]|uniref:F-box protein At5g07610-like n=1 Tax=Rosa rugosa TaxID=74645 RepID=UPI002B405D95|nr:F-box protein At5g07610-like [Rosa rugosa]